MYRWQNPPVDRTVARVESAASTDRRPSEVRQPTTDPQTPTDLRPVTSPQASPTHAHHIEENLQKQTGSSDLQHLSPLTADDTNTIDNLVKLKDNTMKQNIAGFAHTLDQNIANANKLDLPKLPTTADAIANSRETNSDIAPQEKHEIVKIEDKTTKPNIVGFANKLDKNIAGFANKFENPQLNAMPGSITEVGTGVNSTPQDQYKMAKGEATTVKHNMAGFANKLGQNVANFASKLDNPQLTAMAGAITKLGTGSTGVNPSFTAQDRHKMAEQSGDKTVKQSMADFAVYTSFLPVSQAYKTDSRVKRAVLIILSMAMTGFMCYQIAQLFMKYYRYPVQIHSQYISPKDQQFPSVTICNLNAIQKNKIAGSELMTRLEAMRDNGTGDLLFQVAEDRYRVHAGVGAGVEINETGMSDFLSSTNHTQWDGLKEVGDTFYQSLSGANQIFNEILEKIDPKTLANYSQTLNDFLLSCRWLGFPCSPKNFTVVDNYKYGRCWTFNPNQIHGVPMVPLVTSGTGPLFGMVLELFIDQSSYIAALSPQAGARVLVHPRGEMPFPGESGFNISPGRATSVGLKKTVTVSLPAPYGACAAASNTTLYTKRYNITYSKPACEHSCIQEKIIDDCGCAFAKYVVPVESRPKICNDDADMTCARDMEGKYQVHCNDSCPMPCSVTEYAMSTTNSAWPSESHKADLMKRISRVSSKMATVTSKNRIAMDVAKLEVYYSDLTYKLIQQSPAYRVEDLISDLGGQVGLYMGITILSVVEIVGLVASLCQVAGQRVYVYYHPETPATSKVSPVDTDISTTPKPPPVFDESQLKHPLTGAGTDT